MRFEEILKFSLQDKQNTADLGETFTCAITNLLFNFLHFQIQLFTSA